MPLPPLMAEEYHGLIRRIEFDKRNWLTSVGRVGLVVSLLSLVYEV